MSSVRFDSEDGVATLIIDNPPLNVLSNGVRGELLTRLSAAAAEERIRAVVICGAGDQAFSAGSDVREFIREMKECRGGERAERELDFLKRVVSFPKPTIAAIEGHALGGGCELAMACDLRIASENSQIGFPEIKLGVFPINAIEGSLRMFGEAKTKELMFFGEVISAPDALRIGFLNRVVPKGRALSSAREMAHRLVQLPGVTLVELKSLINYQYGKLLDEGGRLARDAASRVFRTEDLQEGVAAFLEKRAPHFRHR
ncbi:MAG: enoyl-CoA hydratase/isomerase family protein [Candidatus Methylomirabilia bacterium]